jgi:hypothetical protein
MGPMMAAARPPPLSDPAEEESLAAEAPLPSLPPEPSESACALLLPHEACEDHRPVGERTYHCGYGVWEDWVGEGKERVGVSGFHDGRRQSSIACITHTLAHSL